MKKILYLLLALAFVLAGCATQSAVPTQAPTTAPAATDAPAATPAPTEAPLVNATGFPIVNEPVTLKAFAVKGPYNKGDFNELAIWKKYQEMTGIKVEFTAVESAQQQEQLGLIFASNQLPDMIFKCGIGTADQTKYADEGTLLPISDYMDYAPNYAKIINDRAEVGKSVKLANGKIYGFPYLVFAQPALISPKLFINKAWADAKGIQYPKTLDELLTVLRAFKDSDYNGNGEKDEIPLGIELPDSFYRSFYGAFGLNNHGMVNGLWDLDPATGKLRYMPTSDAFKEYLQYLNVLYTEKLVDQEVFTVDIAKFSAKAQQNLYGLAFIHNNNYLSDYKDDFTNLPASLEGPHGDKLYAGRNLSVSGQNTFITKANQYPEATVRWVDYFYGDEGICLFFMGIEGETWQKDANGNPQYTDLVKKNPDGLSSEDVLGKYVAWSGGGNPSVADDLHFGNHLIPQITLDGAAALQPFTPEEVWGAFSYSSEDSQRLTVVSQDITTYVTDMRAKFITGNTSFDKWDEYVNTVKSMGLEEFTAIIQRGLDSYNSK